MTHTVDELLQGLGYDVFVYLSRRYRVERVRDVALQVPGVSAAESWGGISAFRLRPDGSEGQAFSVLAPPAETEMLRPQVLEGRWLLPADTNAIVLNTLVLQEEPGIAVNDEIVLEIRGRETTWRVVGIVRPVLPDSTAYAEYDYFSRVTHDVGRASYLALATERHDDRFQTQVAKDLEGYFDREGLSVLASVTASGQRQAFGFLFNILITFLMAMAILTAVVGGIGLMGTMLLNVLERIREVGVMRAIGAKTDAVVQIFVVEGAIIGLLSWLIAVVLAWPLGKLISSTVGEQLVELPLSYTFSLTGVGIWLAAAVAISAVSSYVPAQNAARLTVREVLSYD
jgi:putative ABC transport system permease protein